MRSIILDYTSQLDVMTGNPTVKSYFTNIGYEAKRIDRAFPDVYSYDNVWELHVWLGKLVWNVPSVKLDSYSFNDEDNRWELTKWIAEKNWDMPELIQNHCQPVLIRVDE